MKIGDILEEKFTGKRGKIISISKNYIYLSIIDENQIWPIHISRAKYYRKK